MLLAGSTQPKALEQVAEECKHWAPKCFWTQLLALSVQRSAPYHCHVWNHDQKHLKTWDGVTLGVSTPVTGKPRCCSIRWLRSLILVRSQSIINQSIIITTVITTTTHLMTVFMLPSWCEKSQTSCTLERQPDSFRKSTWPDQRNCWWRWTINTKRRWCTNQEVDARGCRSVKTGH